MRKPLKSKPASSSIPLKKSRSQHFLTDASVLEGEAEALDARGEAVLEIGAGDGRLSEKLLARGPSSLTLVELDPKWADYLKEKFERDARVSVMCEDFLLIPDDFPASRIAGNIPYQITSQILLKLGRMKFEKAVLCVQKEVAGRMAAKAGTSNYGRLSVYAQLHFDLQILAQVPRASFTPQPKVDSSVVLLQPSASARSLPPHLDLVTAALFSHRLQTIPQALVHARRLWGWDKDEARQWGRKLKMDQTRVFQLGPKELLGIARLLPPPAAPQPFRHAAAKHSRQAG
jgi:16S rRNA (adenine1518-N6/adenine1519-N6)-dimethyltransferase